MTTNMARNNIELTAAEQRRIISFSDFAATLYRKLSERCERDGIEPMECPICADLSAVLGSVEYFIQEHAENG